MPQVWKHRISQKVYLLSGANARMGRHQIRTRFVTRTLLQVQTARTATNRYSLIVADCQNLCFADLRNWSQIRGGGTRFIVGEREMEKITIGNSELYCGDCFDILPELDVTADAIISDPPFACTNLKWDEKINLPRFWGIVESKSKPNANYILFGTMRFATDLINSRPDYFSGDLVWSKNTRCGFLWANHQTLRSHEHILRFTRPGEFKRATYNAQRTPGGKIGTTRTIHRSPNGVYGSTKTCAAVRDGLIHPSSVLHFDSDRGNNQQAQFLHPTQKPVALMEWLIRSFSNEGDLIIDPFMGAGSTGVACARTNRRFIGIEREAKYFDLTIKRLQAPRDANLLADEPPQLFRSSPTDYHNADSKQVAVGTGN